MGVGASETSWRAEGPGQGREGLGLSRARDRMATWWCQRREVVRWSGPWKQLRGVGATKSVGMGVRHGQAG